MLLENLSLSEIKPNLIFDVCAEWTVKASMLIDSSSKKRIFLRLEYHLIFAKVEFQMMGLHPWIDARKAVWNGLKDFGKKSKDLVTEPVI